MIYRIRQFFKGLTACRTDCEVIYKYLNDKEIDLFNKLPPHEKRHAVDTAYTVMKIYSGEDEDILIKSALLHDIGKIEGKTGIMKKSILVLMDKFAHRLSVKLSHRIKMFDIYYNHPEAGAELLEKIRTDEKAILLVRYHHAENYADEYTMDILKKADSMN
ncbi:HD domain protein [Oxobacter pfennigii]|uniref:HD domain protein n=1 Tax=Oxobacter pfennigii TaxID=36849 RepID=A0A0P8W323_9CLOT|nr:HDIG domain-containing metalloprotein [Oxobacter pfennigii]KPU42982.1 HD domain protein [Oxobacter pfennigii]